MNTSRIAPEQIRYAEWLRWSGWFGLALLVGTFLLYAFGVLAPLIPVEELALVWNRPSGDLLQQTGRSAGWDWLFMLDKGDMLNMLGIAILAGCSVLPLLAVTGIYLRRGDRLFAVLCLLQVAVLMLAASGVISAGH